MASVGISWRRRCKTRVSLRELDSQGTVFFLGGGLAVTTAGGRVRSFLCGENLNSAKGGWSYHVFVCMARHPRGRYIANPVLSLEVAIAENRSLVDAVNHMQGNPPLKRFLGDCSSPFMRLVQHLTALRAWCKQRLPGR